MKCIEWQYEREWRMLMPLEMASRKICKEANILHLFDFSPDTIKGIRLGAIMDKKE